MSSRRERRKKLYSTPKEAPIIIQSRVRSNPVLQRSIGTSGQVRTISPRTFKIILIASVIVFLLWITAPKPPAPPGGQSEAFGAQVQDSLRPLELNNLTTTIPPVNTSTGSALGETLKGKIKIN